MTHNHNRQSENSPEQFLRRANKMGVGDWVYRGLVLLGLAVNLWLNAHYATKIEFDNLSDNVSKMKDTVNGLIFITNATTKEQQDHETRLRIQEGKPSTVAAVSPLPPLVLQNE